MHRFSKYLALAVVVVAATASPALAQVCTGLPMATRSTNLVFGMDFPDNADIYAFELRHKATDAVVVTAGYALTQYDINLPSSHNFTVGGAYEIPLTPRNADADLAICPVATFGYGQRDELTILTIPFGASIGAAFRVGDGSTTIAPFVNPFYMWQRFSGDGLSITDDDVGFTLGSNVLISAYFFGVGYTKVGDGDGRFGIRFGMTF